MASHRARRIIGLVDSKGQVYFHPQKRPLPPLFCEYIEYRAARIASRTNAFVATDEVQWLVTELFSKRWMRSRPDGSFYLTDLGTLMITAYLEERGVRV